MQDYFKHDFDSALGMPITEIKGIGTRRAQLLEKVGVSTLGDFLFYFPRRYEDRRDVKAVSGVFVEEEQIVRGVVEKLEYIQAKSLKIVKARLTDGLGFLDAAWYNQPWVRTQLMPGDEIVVVGTVSRRYGKWEMAVREYEKASSAYLTAGRIVPVYPALKNLPQKVFRQAAYLALEKAGGKVPDRVPYFLREKYSLVGVDAALNSVHFPASPEDLERARRRLVFEELFLFQMCLGEVTGANRETTMGINHNQGSRYDSVLLQNLPFAMTEGQKRVVREIAADMAGEKPMRRLLQGDVGSGKTLVAALAMLKAVSNGSQAVMMVPTEVLAEQQYYYLSKILKPTGVAVALFTGRVMGEERNRMLEVVANGKVDILVGTQALIQGQLRFKKLGLAVIDEQHRFGVKQRSFFGELNPTPDILVMTATPIPRSLALTLYGDLDLSVIRELPAGRSPVKTRFVPRKSRLKMYDFVKKQLDAGRQAFVVCPRIEESETLEIVAAEELAAELQRKIFVGYRLALLHGRLPAETKETIMEDFRSGGIDLLVSTTVIEVGVDIANASVMVIEGAERFGLAQLHQLRGRVGRGTAQSYCFLLGRPATAEARERIRALVRMDDGFKIAEEDLGIRGPGEFFGTKQHGLPQFKIADLVEDAALAEATRNEAVQIRAGSFPGSAEERQNLFSWCKNIASGFDAN